MKKIVILLAIICISSCVHADINTIHKYNMPEGTFKKKSNGEFVQYDSKGKKIGVYKLTRGRFVRIK